jgi:anti-sigma factor (TIGR02949 family)
VIACKEAVERLWTYLDRKLDRRLEEEVEQHLGICRHCCGELEFAKQIREKLAASRDDEIPADTRARLEGLLRGLGS